LERVRKSVRKRGEEKLPRKEKDSKDRSKSIARKVLLVEVQRSRLRGGGEVTRCEGVEVKEIRSWEISDLPPKTFDSVLPVSTSSINHISHCSTGSTLN
jgi:hypothetical protein